MRIDKIKKISQFYKYLFLLNTYFKSYIFFWNNSIFSLFIDFKIHFIKISVETSTHNPEKPSIATAAFCLFLLSAVFSMRTIVLQKNRSAFYRISGKKRFDSHGYVYINLLRIPLYKPPCHSNRRQSHWL